MTWVEWVESWPAPIRHLLAAFLGVFVTVLGAAVVSAGGVTGVDWGPTVVGALDEAAVAAVGVLLALYITPLTDAYGVGKVSEVKDKQNESKEAQ